MDYRIRTSSPAYRSPMATPFSVPQSLVTVDAEDAVQRKEAATLADAAGMDGNQLDLVVRRMRPALPVKSVCALAPAPLSVEAPLSGGITLGLHAQLCTDDGHPLVGAPVCFWYEDRHGWRLPVEASPLDFVMFTHGMQLSDEQGRVGFTMPYPTAVQNGQGPVVFVRAYLPEGHLVHSYADGVLQLPSGQNPFFVPTPGASEPTRNRTRHVLGAPLQALQGLSLDVATARVQARVGLTVRVPCER